MIAEKAVLGSMLKENYLISESNLSAEQFVDGVNRNIFRAMNELRKENKAVDIITLLTSNAPQDLGGANYLSDLSNFSQVEKFDSHVEAMLEVWRNREKKNILHVASAEDWDIERVTSELAGLTDNRVNDHSDIASLLIEVYESPFVKSEVKSGAPSGIDKLDTMLNGFQNGELTILAGRPSMGKSDVMLHIAKAAGWKSYLPIIFSLEMPGKSLRDRLIASTGRYSRIKMRDPYELLNDAQKMSWTQAIGHLSNTKIQIFDRPGQTVSEMRMKVRKMVNQHKGMKPVVFIDYLTLIRSTEKESNNHLRVSEITKSLKGMAREFECPVIVLAQLSRAVEQRQDKRPIMSDLRESGSIEEDADVIIFLYREAYYSKEEENNLLELIVAKDRNGPIGTVITAYNKFTGEVMNIERDGKGATA